MRTRNMGMYSPIGWKDYEIAVIDSDGAEHIFTEHSDCLASAGECAMERAVEQGIKAAEWFSVS